MKYFLDTEFVEDGHTIDLISIGIVAEDGRTFYAISLNYDLIKARRHPFVSEFVLPHVYRGGAGIHRTRHEIARGVRDFITAHGPEIPEIWADYAAYDWIAFCQLWGTMLDLPEGFPMFCRDVQQLRDQVPEVVFPNRDNDPNLHHALLDAQDCKTRHDLCLSALSGRAVR